MKPEPRSPPSPGGSDSGVETYSVGFEVSLMSVNNVRAVIAWLGQVASLLVTAQGVPQPELLSLWPVMPGVAACPVSPVSRHAYKQ